MFTLLGITASRALKRHRNFSRTIRISLVVILLALLGPMSSELLTKIQAGRNETLGYPVTRKVSRALHDRVDLDPGVEIMFMARPSSREGVVVHIAAEQALPTSYADELRQIVRDQMNDPILPVYIVAVHGMWRSDYDGDTLR